MTSQSSKEGRAGLSHKNRIKVAEDKMPLLVLVEVFFS